jgi:uncharacterized protein with FMN-binding domain
MLRAVATLGGTVAGLAALLAFKTHAPADTTAGSPASVVAPATGATTSAAASSAAMSSAATRVVTGATVSTQHGPMQVQLTLAGQRITKVTVLQQTNDGGESVQLNATAIPRLTSETLAAQSAHIDAVSGASYTSAGYIGSLQSALDKAAG